MRKPMMPHHRSAQLKYASDIERSNQSGFALIIALSLMAFVLALLLSITTLGHVVRVESSLASQQIQSNQAKANALLALNVALCELQKYAGPDQRVTGRADITASSNSNQITYESTLLNPYLVNLNETRRRSVRGVMKRDSLYFWDFYYLINDEIFDSYFFLAISQSGGLETLNPLYKTDISAPINELRNFNLAAKHIELIGGFSVKSTSVDAWMALLSAYRGVPYGTSNDDSLFARCSNPAGELIAEAEPESGDAGTACGYRRLTDMQIQNLRV
ncbi:hypothetical protein H5P28_14280 [Ruficoccus amylovorans]|uniref:Uncharacterized protein n=1 Tax=Ruficoccus amylovorans TaxID=1804625 RepID=A0A842HJU6_9BACT|nr:hypothetical protein [Ruficoccus amylovorans]MBC2595431.1 hypothetical protein [Ruficoccus amylovorans]